MLNNITIAGRLTRDPELRYTKSNTPVASFTVACDRDFGDHETDFIDCVAWKNTAEFVSKYFTQGTLAIVNGRLESKKWQDRDGKTRTSWNVVASSVYFGESKRRETSPAAPKMTELDDDDGELPF